LQIFERKWSAPSEGNFDGYIGYIASIGPSRSKNYMMHDPDGRVNQSIWVHAIMAINNTGARYEY